VFLFTLGYLLAAALVMWLGLRHTNLRTMWDHTFAYQAGRAAPFSIWGLWDWTGAEKVAEGVAAAIAVLLAVLPRRRDLVGLAALCGAAIIAVEVTLSYWFYLYIVWFVPLVLIALFGRNLEPGAKAAQRDAPELPPAETVVLQTP
jgi:hypothetical protein